MARGRKRIALALSLACTPALAQQASAPATTTPAPSSAADSNSLDRPKAAELFRESGSLFEASASAHGIESTQVRASAVSFFAVPKPEPRVLKKHDLVTIIIREESEVSADGNTDLKKEAALQATVEEWIRLNFRSLSDLSNNNPENLPSIRMNGNREFKGEAKVDRTDSFIGRIQAEVVDVKPNGTFVVQARKRIKFDEEEQEFILSGVCRAADVTPDNTVLSTQVYNLELEKKHKGQVRNTTKKGLIPRLVDFINPF